MRETRYHNLASHLGLITCALNGDRELLNISSIEMDSVYNMRDWFHTDVHLRAPATVNDVAEWAAPAALGITDDPWLIEERGDRIVTAGEEIRVFASKTPDSRTDADFDNTDPDNNAAIVDTLARIVCALMAHGPDLQDIERIDFENPQQPKISLRGAATTLAVDVWAKALGNAARQPYGIAISGTR